MLGDLVNWYESVCVFIFGRGASLPEDIRVPEVRGVMTG